VGSSWPAPARCWPTPGTRPGRAGLGGRQRGRRQASAVEVLTVAAVPARRFRRGRPGCRRVVREKTQPPQTRAAKGRTGPASTDCGHRPIRVRRFRAPRRLGGGSCQCGRVSWER
jgi:hypothetical protein